MNIDNIWVWLSTNWEGITAICALTLTLAQIFFSRQHDKLSVTPQIGTSLDTTDKKNYYILIVTLTNCGLGTAIINKYSIFYKEKLISLNNHNRAITKLTKIVSKLFHNYDLKINSFTKNGMLAQNSRDVILELKINKPYDEKTINKFIKDLNIQIEYQSFYGQKFYFNSNNYSMGIE